MTRRACLTIARGIKRDSEATRLIRRAVANPLDALQEEEVGDRRQLNARHGAPSDRAVRLVPQTDVRHLLGNEALHVGEESAPPNWIRRGRGLVQQRIDPGVPEES